MFIDTTFRKFQISDKDKIIGKMNINDELIKKSSFVRPFIRENTNKMIVKVGNRDYNMLNNFIINSMQDYYDRLVNSKSSSEKDMMLKTYNHLYEMWQDLYNQKRIGNLSEMDKTYDLFSYELYVLGYYS